MQDLSDSLAQPGTDSVLYYDPAVFGRVAALDTLLTIHRWALDLRAWRYVSHPVDSSFSQAHHYAMATPHRATVVGQGMLFSPYQSDEFLARPELAPDVPRALGNVLTYVAQPVPLYNVRRHFARFDAVSSAQSNKGVLYGDLLLTQNVNPALNIGFLLRHGEDKVEYLNMSSKYNSGLFFASFAHRRLFVNFSGGFTTLTARDHGGIQSPRWLTDTVADIPLIPTNLSDAQAVIHHQDVCLDFGFDLVQRVRVIPDSTEVLRLYREPVLSLISMHTYRSVGRAYTDFQHPKEHPPYFISNLATRDTVASLVYEGRVGVAYRHTPHARFLFPSLRAWLGYRLARLTMPTPRIYLDPDISTNFHSAYVGGAMEYPLPFADLNASGAFFFAGERALDARLDAQMQVFIPKWRDRIQLFVDYELSVEGPSFFDQSYFSNAYAWQVDLRPTLYTGLGATLRAPWWGGSYGVHNRLYARYTYFDEAVRPRQAEGVNVLSVYVEQRNVLYGFALDARVVMQLSSRPEDLSLPLLSAFASVGYQYPLIPRVLTLKLAVEAYYRTLYHADAYCSQLGVFHRQREYQIGNYPLANLVLSAKWKQVNLYAMLVHADQDLFGRNYFAGVLYPEPARGFRFGLQWSFYD